MKLYHFSLILPVIFLFLSISSCRKNFSLEEIDKLKADSIFLEGSVAIPLVNTELTLSNFIPANDSTLWAEVDDEGLLHLRMYVNDLIVLQMNQIFNTVTFPAPAGTPILADSTSLQSDTTRMKVYSKMLSGKLFFKNPKISFLTDNQIPVVTFLKMDTLTFHDADGNALSHTSDKDYIINAPSIYGTTVKDTVAIDTTEMPILPNVFSPVPKFVSFYMTLGNKADQSLPFIVSGNEQIFVDVDIDLPLHARLDTIVMTDTVNFNLTGDTYEQIKSATLKMRFNNGFPIEAYTQIYFVDTTATGEIGTIIDSVFTDLSHPSIYEEGWWLGAAITNPWGIVTTPKESNMEVFLDQEKINFLKENNVSKMIIKGKLNSYDSQSGFFVKIMGYYKMGVRIAIKADFEGSTN